MQNTTEKSSRSAEGLYKFFIYFVLVLLAVTIIVPVAWVFMASIKQNAEFYGNPWALPAGFYWQNFVNAWNGAKMGEYMLNSVIVTALALALLLFSAVFFAFVLFFSLRPGKITVWIGKIINPVFLLFLAVLVIAALLKPGASISDVAPTEPYATKTSAFFSSFIEGYGTMDAIAGLAFGIVVIDVIRRMGVDNDDAVAVDVLGSGVLTGLLMAVIYVVTILMGTQSRGLFEISDNGGIALTQIAGHYFGGVGQIILAVTITFACLKTSIGLVTSCSETFVKMTHGKISYKLWAILFTLFSFAVSNVGLSAIIEYSIPVLMLIYPPATALIILAFAGKLFRHDRAVYLSTMIFTWAAAIFDFFKTLPAGVRTALRLDAPVELAKRYLPLFDLNLGWLLPAVAGFVIGMAIHLSRRDRAK